MLGRIGVAALGALVLGLVALAAASLARPHGLRPPPTRPAAILIEPVRLVTLAPGAPDSEPDRAVLVIGDEIAAVGLAGELALPASLSAGDVVRIDGQGRTLLPGLIDAHIHLWDEAELAGYLAHGVTGVRNMSGMPFHLDLAERIESGRLLGPSLITTGPILNSPGPNQQDNHRLVSTGDEARAAVRRQYDQGYGALKIYSNLERDAYLAVLDEASQLGMTVSGHTPEGFRSEGIPYDHPFEIRFEDVLDDGMLTIEHTESIVWHGLRDRLDTEAMARLADEIAAHRVTVTPTLIAHDNLIRVAQSEGAYLSREGTDTLNPLISHLESGVYDFWSSMDPEPREVPRAAFYRDATRQMHEAGVTLLAGSDAGIFTNLPGRSLTRELELLVSAGLSPYEALRTATVNPAETFGWTDRGRIAPGQRADLILVEGDPLAEISVVEYPAGVMVGGVWLDRDRLDALERAAAHTSMPRTARHLAAGLMAQN
jgi:imidazolonepropionase-like amidohydrolase